MLSSGRSWMEMMDSYDSYDGETKRAIDRPAILQKSADRVADFGKKKEPAETATKRMTFWTRIVLDPARCRIS